MILVFDVGNTETTIGVWDGDTLVAHWRITSGQSRTADELGVLLLGLLGAAGLAPSRITGVAIGSVVPPLTDTLRQACAGVLGAASVVVVDARAPLPIRLDVEEPLTVGADRIINTLAASRRYGRDAIVVDLGTATTFDCITADGVFLGGIIAPGVRTSAENLVRRTSKLPATELVAPARALGRRTEDCIRAGVIFGAAESIDGLVRRLKAEWPRPAVPVVVATGGLAEAIGVHCREVEHIEPHLTIEGLRLAFGLLHQR
jgi:type III pantothenate kinase